MWVCLNNAFLSIVHKDCAPDELLVRARRPGDIERVFPDAEVTDSWGTDYQFRAIVKREQVADAMISLAMTVDYSNFKNSVRDDKLHDAYSRFWHEHARLQPRRPYTRRPASGRKVPA